MIGTATPVTVPLHPVVELLLTLAPEVDRAVDDSEERQGDDGERVHMLTSTATDALTAALDALEELPDDQPGYTMGPAARARWALRANAMATAHGNAEDLWLADMKHQNCPTCGGSGHAADAPTSLRAACSDARAAGVEVAARWVDCRRAAFDTEHGHTDPETGAFEYGRGARAQAAQEYSAELEEIAEGLRALIAPVTAEFAGHVVGANGPIVHVGDLQADEASIETSEADAREVRP